MQDTTIDYRVEYYRVVNFMIRQLERIKAEEAAEQHLNAVIYPQRRKALQKPLILDGNSEINTLKNLGQNIRHYRKRYGIIQQFGDEGGVRLSDEYLVELMAEHIHANGTNILTRVICEEKQKKRRPACQQKRLEKCL